MEEPDKPLPETEAPDKPGPPAKNKPRTPRPFLGGGNRTLALVLVAMLAGYLLADRGRTWFRDGKEAERRFETMRTYGRIRVLPGRGLTDSPARLAEMAETAVQRVAELMSPGGDASDVARLNRTPAGQWVEVNPLTWHVVMESLRWHRLSGGAFDPTIGPIMRLFRFEQGDVSVWPSPEALGAARALVGADKLLFQREGMRLAWEKDGMRLDLGAIAKGYAVDLAADILIKNGVTRGLVDVGGELRLIGRREDGPDGEWRAGIRSPRGDEVLERLQLENVAVATSGDYERYFTYQGKRYEHTIDPRTGMPQSGGPASVTVIHPTSCLAADALATTLCVLGVDKGREFIESQALGLFSSGVRVIMIVQNQDGDWRRVEIQVDDQGETEVRSDSIVVGEE